MLRPSAQNLRTELPVKNEHSTTNGPPVERKLKLPPIGSQAHTEGPDVWVVVPLFRTLFSASKLTRKTQGQMLTAASR
jgi:hypothetical protein